MSRCARHCVRTSALIAVLVLFVASAGTASDAAPPVADSLSAAVTQEKTENAAEADAGADALQLSASERQWIRDNPVVSFTGDPNWLPYEAFTPEGKYVGIVADHLELIANRTGLRFDPQPVGSWSESLRVAAEGKVSVISGDAADVVLNRHFNPVETYSRNPIVIVMDSRQHYVESLEEIRDRRIAIIKDYGYTADIFARYPEFEFIEVENIQQGLEGVSQGRFDTLLATMALASYTIAEMGLHNVKVVGKTPIIMDLTLFVAKGQPQLHAIIEKSLQSVTTEESQQILQRWIRNRYVERTDYRVAFAVAAGLLSLLAFTLFWILRLRREIASRREAEAALQESQNLLQEAQARAHIGNWVLDTGNMKAAWSEEVYRMLGIPVRDDVGPEFLSTLLHPEDRDSVLASLQAAAADCCKHNMEYRVVRPTGEVRWVRCVADQIYDGNGRVTRLRGVIQDITSLKQEQLKLRESEERYRTIFEGAPTGVWLIGPDRRTLQVNQSLCELLGYGAEEMIGKAPTEFADEPNKQIFIAQTAKIESTDKRVYQIELQHRDGHLIPTLFHATTLHQPDGSVLAAVAFVTDLSEQKANEAELQRLRNYMSNIIDSMPSMLVGVDAEGVITQWNRESQRVTGLAASEVIGKPLAQAMPRFAAENERIKRAIADRREISDSKRSRPEGSGLRYEDVTIYPLIANGAQGAVLRIDDVTEQVRMEEMMIQSEKMLSVGGLAAGMAHEINNPLAGIMQTAEVMASRLRNGGLAANQRAAEEAGTSMEAITAFMQERRILGMIDSLMEAGRRVADIVSNMLSFARKSGSQVSTEALDALMDKALELASTDYDMKKQYDFKQIDIVKEYALELPMVPCDATKIQQVLLNILRNGAQALQESGTQNPRITLRTRYDEESGMACMEIKDNGPGMDEVTRRRVFEPFFTTKQVGEGTGLGLSVSYFIVTDNHHGQMRVNTALGKGTTFIVCLPLAVET